MLIGTGRGSLVGSHLLVLLLTSIRKTLTKEIISHYLNNIDNNKIAKNNNYNLIINNKIVINNFSVNIIKKIIGIRKSNTNCNNNTFSSTRISKCK